jgi:hypothetical protein
MSEAALSMTWLYVTHISVVMLCEGAARDLTPQNCKFWTPLPHATGYAWGQNKADCVTKNM